MASSTREAAVADAGPDPHCSVRPRTWRSSAKAPGCAATGPRAKGRPVIADRVINYRPSQPAGRAGEPASIPSIAEHHTDAAAA